MMRITDNRDRVVRAISSVSVRQNRKAALFTPITLRAKEGRIIVREMTHDHVVMVKSEWTPEELKVDDESNEIAIDPLQMMMALDAVDGERITVEFTSPICKIMNERGTVASFRVEGIESSPDEKFDLPQGFTHKAELQSDQIRSAFDRASRLFGDGTFPFIEINAGKGVLEVRVGDLVQHSVQFNDLIATNAISLNGTDKPAKSTFGETLVDVLRATFGTVQIFVGNEFVVRVVSGTEGLTVEHVMAPRISTDG